MPPSSSDLDRTTQPNDPFPATSPSANPPSDNSAEDLVDLLLKANTLEQAGDIEGARQLYLEIIDRDASGVWGPSAQKALDELPGSDGDAATATETAPPPETPAVKAPIQAPVSAAATAPARRSQQGISLGTKLKLLTAIAAIVPATIVVGASWWLQPRPSSVPVPDTPASEALTLQQRPQLPLLLILGGASTIAVLAAILPLMHRWAQQVRAIARYSQNICLDRPPTRLDIPRRGDEVSAIAENLQDLGQRLNQQNQRLSQLESQRDRELRLNQQEKERLQQQALDLLERLEAARAGDLTVQAPLSDGEVGAIADAFNATTRSLRNFVAQTASVTASVTERTQDSETAVRQLSDAARQQSEELQTTLATVKNIAVAIEALSVATENAAQLARDATVAAQHGDTDVEAAVASMERLRTTVANTAKKAKRLAESAQEVSQILAVVSGISERANLLAFNAAIEAARAGEQGEGFRQVADDVRGLAAQIGESAGDIERLVNGIQEETAEVLDVLESGTGEVVNSSQSVRQTQQTLRRLVELSHDIDLSLQEVAQNSAERARDSSAVDRVMEDANRIALANADEAQRVEQVLQGLLAEVEALKSAMAQFQVE